MTAIVSVPDDTGNEPEGCPALRPLFDRPFLQHIVEFLAGRGFARIHFVLGRDGEAVERHFGDGRRWGCSFHYYLTPDPGRPAGPLAAAVAIGGGPVLVGQADRLPLLPDFEPGDRVVFDADGRWTGWAVADAEDLRKLPRSLAWPGLDPHLVRRGAKRVGVERVLEFRSLADVPAACRALLESDFAGMLPPGREVRPGVRLGAGAAVAPSAVLVPPVFVGAGTVVRAAARVGPHAVIGPGCLVDTGAVVRNAVVLPGTHVGVGVELDGVVADRDHLIDPSGAGIIRVDPHLLGELPVGVGVAALAGRAGERAAAALAFVLVLPVLAAAAAWLRATRPGPVFWRRRFVRTSGNADESRREATAVTLAPPRPTEDQVGWVVEPTLRGLVQELLPALPAVAAGRLRLVGLPPRGPGLADRRPRFPAASPGLISEAGLVGPAGLTVDDARTVAAYQAQTSSAAADLGRVARFLARAVAARPAA